MLSIQQIKTVRQKTQLLPDQLYDLNDLPEFLLSQKHFEARKKIFKKLGAVKRTSPFLITAVCIPALFVYAMISGVENLPNKWFLFFVMTFVEVNILMIDFALWNYYEGKKKLRIWLIEVSILFFALYLVV